MQSWRSVAGRAAWWAAGALALATMVAQAQTVTGVVRSAGQPVAGAAVRLLELDRLERSRADGSFRFSNVPPGTYRIFVGVLGYASATDTIQVTGPTASA